MLRIVTLGAEHWHDNRDTGSQSERRPQGRYRCYPSIKPGMNKFKPGFQYTSYSATTSKPYQFLMEVYQIEDGYEAAFSLFREQPA